MFERILRIFNILSVYRKTIFHKRKIYLTIYKPPEFQPTFIGISSPKKTNIAIGCIYKHLNLNLNKFN